MRVLVCGSRTFDNDAEYMDPIGTLLQGIAGNIFGGHVLIHGDAPGADTDARLSAEVIDGFTIEAYPANWQLYGKKAGYVRNARMLREGKPDVVWAFVDKPLEESKGTAMMVELARKAGVPTYVVQSG